LRFYRELLSVRRQHIVPLLPHLRTGEATFAMLAERAFEVSWPRDGGGALGVLANLSSEPLSGVGRPKGTVLYAISANGNREDRLGPWSVRWFFKP
jgi:maltooligosyltrehalose trehalohydrolase